jgi:hypothetical protein
MRPLGFCMGKKYFNKISSLLHGNGEPQFFSVSCDNHDLSTSDFLISSVGFPSQQVVMTRYRLVELQISPGTLSQERLYRPKYSLRHTCHQTTASTTQGMVPLPPVYLETTVGNLTHVRKEIKIILNSDNLCWHLVLQLPHVLLLNPFLIQLLNFVLLLSCF